jgi:TetR/AcrR family transcriptional repressor of nem operon
MGRASKAEAAAHRARAVEEAARLFRERGIDSIPVKEVMSQIGLTAGGFYRQFSSKEELVGEATGSAFDQLTGLLDDIVSRRAGDRAGAREELLERYLSPSHRDDPGAGCPATALGGDTAHSAPGRLREAYAEGVENYLAALDGFTVEPDSRAEQVTLLATLVGALTLARATAGTPLSDTFLDTLRGHLAQAPQGPAAT